ncbi:hypothetical protein BC332_24564 [Capsicum chinense]|nr:hypothetical protein BC332_24564 [Capsicum chinense]
MSHASETSNSKNTLICHCGNVVVLRTSCTDSNLGRKFYNCAIAKVELPYNSDIPRAVWNPSLTWWGSPQPEYTAMVGVSNSDTPHGGIPYKSDIPRAIWNPLLTPLGVLQTEYTVRVGVLESDMPQNT